MDSNPENRAKTRFEHVSKVTLENSDIGLQRDAKMYNFSDMGLYFEADFLLQLETEIRIGISNSPFTSEPDQFESYRGVVRWRKELKRSLYYYGYGIELIKEHIVEDSLDRDIEARKHPRKACNIPVKYEFKEQRHQGTAKNVSIGGVFVETQNSVAVGQQIKMEIPIKKKDTIAKFVGRITWSNRKGFGVNFLRMAKKTAGDNL